MKIIFILIIIAVFFSSCKKYRTEKNIVGEWVWTLQTTTILFNNYTPQSTGIHETLSLTKHGIYNMKKNGIVTNTGFYKISKVTGSDGQKVLSLLFTNTRVKDSTEPFIMRYDNDSLFFSQGLLGWLGAGSRHYGRQ